MSKENVGRKVFSFDAETNGLYGKAFAISAVVQNEDGSVKEFLARCPIEGEVNEWVAENVLPPMDFVEETHSDYDSMLKDFMQFYMDNKENADVIVHMGVPVEAKLFIDGVDKGYIGEFDGPYPLIDVSAFPEVRDSVATYNKNNNVEMENVMGGTHNPLYDSYEALATYNHWMDTHAREREQLLQMQIDNQKSDSVSKRGHEFDDIVNQDDDTQKGLSE